MAPRRTVTSFPTTTMVTVAVKIDDDSGKGVVFVKQTRLTGTDGVAEVTDAITVTVAQVPSKISVKPVSPSRSTPARVLPMRASPLSTSG